MSNRFFKIPKWYHINIHKDIFEIIMECEKIILLKFYN